MLPYCYFNLHFRKGGQSPFRVYPTPGPSLVVFPAGFSEALSTPYSFSRICWALAQNNWSPYDSCPCERLPPGSGVLLCVCVCLSFSACVFLVPIGLLQLPYASLLLLAHNDPFWFNALQLNSVLWTLSSPFFLLLPALLTYKKREGKRESKDTYFEGELLSVSSHCHKPLQWTDCLGQKRRPWRQTSLGRGRLSFLLPAPCTPHQVRQASRKPPGGPTMSVLGDGMDRQKQDSGGRSLKCCGVSGGASSTPFSPAPYTGMGWACTGDSGASFLSPQSCLGF